MPVAVVTGAGGGLGRAIALELASRGLLVQVTDVDDGAAARSGSLDLWVNNAGVLATGPAWEQDAETRRTMLEVNALGTMSGTVAALEEMRPAGRGQVINVSRSPRSARTASGRRC